VRPVHILFLSCLPALTPAQQPVLRVLEEIPAPTTADRNFRVVRVPFQETSIGWQAFPSNCPAQQCLKTVTAKFPPETHWTIAFDGKSLGTLTARTPHEFASYSHIGLQKIVANFSVPSIGKPSTEFGAAPDQPLHGPLVAISIPNVQDPDSWKPAPLSPEFLALLSQQFRQKFPNHCHIRDPLPYTDADVHLVKSYASNSHWVVAHLHVEDAIECRDTQAGFQMPDPWFTVSPEKSAQYLASGLSLIDAGDYDHSGDSQLLFSLSADNRCGYRLYFDNFLCSVSFEFSYH
jgi:hypothetical protein